MATKKQPATSRQSSPDLVDAQKALKARLKQNRSDRDDLDDRGVKTEDESSDD